MPTTLTVGFVSAFALYFNQQTTVQSSPQGFQENKTTCAKENGVQASDGAKIWIDPEYPANNHRLKCYYACVWVKKGIISNGRLENVDFSKLFEGLDNTTSFKEAEDKCSDIPHNNDQCELAYQLIRCVVKASPHLIELNKSKTTAS